MSWNRAEMAARAARELRAGAIQRQLPAMEGLGIEIAEHEVGIGDRGLGAAPAVAHGTRLRARAAAPVDPRRVPGEECARGGEHLLFRFGGAGAGDQDGAFVFVKNGLELHGKTFRQGY